MFAVKYFLPLRHKHKIPMENPFKLEMNYIAPDGRRFDNLDEYNDYIQELYLKRYDRIHKKRFTESAWFILFIFCAGYLFGLIMSEIFFN